VPSYLAIDINCYLAGLQPEWPERQGQRSEMLQHFLRVMCFHPGVWTINGAALGQIELCDDQELNGWLTWNSYSLKTSGHSEYGTHKMWDLRVVSVL
jgi:hypothetical protein